jgi:hypothetical protein
VFQSVLSQWVDETSVVLDAEEEGGSSASYPETRGESASSYFVVDSQNDNAKYEKSLFCACVVVRKKYLFL